MSHRNCAMASAVLTLVHLLGWSGFVARASEAPATVAEAAKVIDFSTFAPIDPANDAIQRCVASQSYAAKGDVEAIAGKLVAQLTRLGFRKPADASITPAYASATFQKGAFAVILTVMPGSEPGTVLVDLSNAGNVDLAKLPLPTGTQTIASLPNAFIGTTDQPVAETQRAIRAALEKQGWQWFGDTTVSYFMRKNAVRLQVMVSEAPAQAGKTSIHLSAEQLSTQLPLPPNAVLIDYSDRPVGLIVDTSQSLPDLIASYRQVFEAAKWKCTTDRPITIDFHEHLIFRGPESELADCEFMEFEGKARCRLKYQTRAEVDRESELIKQAAAAAEKKRNEPKQVQQIVVKRVAKAEVTEQQENSIEMSTRSGAAAGILKTWLAEMKAEGWKLTATVNTASVAELTLSKDNHDVRVSMIDPGVIPGSITLSVSGDSRLSFHN